MKQLWIVLFAALAAAALPASTPDEPPASAGSETGTTMTDGRGSTMAGYGNCVSMTTPSGTFMGTGC